MSKQTLRIAIVGSGAISQFHYAPAINEIAQTAAIEVSAIYDPVLERASILKQNFANAHIVNSIADLPLLSIDLAIVASPASYHAEQTCELLANGVSVLCEKPMATQVSPAESMIAQAKASKKVLAIGLFRRFFPSLQMVKQIIASNMLGPVKSFSFSEGGQFSWPVQSSALFHKDTTGGGILLDIGSHVLDLIAWWFGKPSQMIYADDKMGGLEANCIIDLLYPGNLTGQVKLSRDWSLPNNYRIDLERGFINWKVGESNQLEIGFHDQNFALTGKIIEQNIQRRFLNPNEEDSTYHQCFVKQLLNVVAAVRGEEDQLVSGAEGILSLKLIEDCYKTRQLMDMPWLSQAELAGAKKFNLQE